MRHSGLVRQFSLICLVGLAALAQDGARRIVPSVSEPRRWALVIGNDDYPRVALKNATNDARSMQSALQKAGFTVSLALNTNLRTLDESILKFLKGVQPGDVALIYYSGHGMQIDGENAAARPGQTAW